LVSVINLPKLVCRKQLLEKKFKEKEAWMGKTMHWDGMWHRKLKTPMKTKFVNKITMFEKTLEFKQGILLCYGR
jgi:hypothetical protein